MPVYLTNTRIKNELDTDPLTWLLANIGEEVTIEYEISVKTYSINSTTSTWVLNNVDGYLGDGWITGGDFSMFDIGDTIQWYNYTTHTFNGTFTIVDKLSNSEIQLNVALGVPVNTQGSQDVFSLVLPVTAFRYKWNLIENADPINYFSKVDGTEQVVSVSGLDVNTPTNNIPMTFLGPLPYQIGEIEIDVVGLGTGDVYSSEFVIRHTTRVTPLFLQFQFDDFLNNIKPTYYDNNKCLKQIAFFEARYNNTNPNAIETLRKDNVLGNTGFFNENFNTGLTNYRIDNLTYTDSSAVPVVLPAVQLKLVNDTKFSFDVINTTDTPFSAGDSLMVLNFAKAPNDEAEYKGNNRDMLHNFVWEKVFLKVDNAPIPEDGDNFADPSLRSLAQVKATFVSSSVVRVSGKISFQQAAIDVFNESNEPRYIMFLSCQNHLTTGATADRVTLMVDASPFFFKTNFPDLLDFQSKIIPHEVNSYTAAFTQRDTFTEDELVGYSLVTIENDEDTNDLEKIITRITSKVVAKNSVTQEEFVLDAASLNTATYPFINGFQYFNIDQPRIFHVPTTEIRKSFIARFDTATSKYEIAFPYLNRWEYWQALLGVDSDFFNTSQPNDGFNHDWVRYYTGNWKLNYVTEIAMKIDGVPQVYTNYTEYKIFNRNLVGENISCVINTFDGATQLIDGGGQKYILGYKDTLVEATFTDTVNNFPPLGLANEPIVLGIEVFEEGGVNGKRRMSSKWASDADTWFISLAAGDKVQLTQLAPGILKGSALIDFTQLNLSKLQWKLSARVYHNNQSALAPSIGITDGYGYMGSEVFKLIKENPIDTTPQPVTPEQMDCCSDFIWRVLAHQTDPDPLYNDINSFLFWFDQDAVDTAVLFLVKNDGTEYALTGISTYGTPYDYGFFVNNQNQKLVGYEIDWRKVLLTLGEGVYYVRCDIETVFGGEDSQLSDTYCLKKYSESRANGTLRIEYYINGLMGKNENDEKVRDYGNLNWYNQHRFDGFFAYNKSSNTTTYIQYENGLDEWVEDDQTPEFLMSLKSIPMFKHNVLRTDIMQSDAMYVTDYNKRNIDTYYKKRVQKITGHEPKWNYLRTKLAPVEIRFKQAFNNLKKFRE